jgi:hypothetical protein
MFTEVGQMMGSRNQEMQKDMRPYLDSLNVKPTGFYIMIRLKYVSNFYFKEKIDREIITKFLCHHRTQTLAK